MRRELGRTSFSHGAEAISTVIQAPVQVSMSLATVTAV